MKLISLNVGLFEKNNNELRQFLSKENPDILALQEVARPVESSVDTEFDSLKAISQGTEDLKYGFYSPVWVHRDFRKKDFHGAETFYIDYGGFLEQGYYLKSRYSIRHGNNPFILNSFQYETVWGNWPDDDARSVQITDLCINREDKADLRILNYHGIWSRDKVGNTATLKACKKILKYAREVEYPVIICGDFNLFPDSLSMKIFKDDFESLVDTYNIDTTRPSTNELSGNKRNVVDYILISKGIKVNNFSVPNVSVSDHLPLILEFILA